MFLAQKPRFINSFVSILALATATLLVSCGGGGGGGTPPGGGGGGDGGGGSPPPVINPGTAGKLFMTSPDSYIEFDLATGISRVMRRKGGAFRPSLDGQEFVLVNRFVAGQAASDDREELVFFGRDGRSSSRFLAANGFGGAPMLSPNKQYVLVEWHSIDSGDAGGVSVPTVFTRDGSIVRRFVDYDGVYAWFPNGEILLSRGDSFFRASATGTAPPQLIASVPGESPSGLTLSPDGTRIAFTIGNFTILENTTWIINADGTGLREVAKTGPGASSITPHSFSPDGQQLLVSEGINFASVGPGFAVAGCAELYVVPLNLSAPLVISPDSPAPAIKLRSVFEDSGDVSEKACAFSTPSWRNMPELPDFTPGTAAQGGGLNNGLNGSAWYGFAGDLYRSNLFTGETTKLAKASNSPFVSYDSAEVIVLDRFLPTNPSVEAVLTLSGAGTQIGRVDYPEGFSSPIKLSPDKTKLVSEYHNLDAGDPGGASIVTVFSRDLSQVIVRWDDARSWDWLADGRLLLADLRQIYITDASLQNATLIATLPDAISGATISRDGSRIAFAMTGNIWMIGSDGTGLKQLTETGRLLGSPEFSPDGRYVLADSVDSPYQTWVVPADGVRVPVHNRAISRTSAFPLQVVEDGEPRLMFPSTGVNWR